ncbi:MAG: DegT/DnrJ/EryC1/StrS family aminotransferase [Candidatus Hodarchaeota archaeon]
MGSKKEKMEWKLALSDIDFGEDEYEGVETVLQSNWLTMGEVTLRFELEFASYLGVKHAIAVNSGTAALHLAHQALGLKEGDEVICPSLTFVATANSIIYTRSKPIFAEITSLDVLNISPDDIKSRISDRTRAILVVHYAGFPCDMKRIMEIAKNYNLFVVEDAAHAPGAEYKSKSKVEGSRQSSKDNSRSTIHDTHAYKVGSIGNIGCFSFFSNKNLVTGEGGMIVTDNDKLAENIKICRSHGMTSLTLDRHKGHSYSYDVIDLGFNYRIDEIRAVLGLAQLKKLDKNNEKRRRLSSLYKEKLYNIKEISVPFSNFEGISSHHIFPILLSGRIDRENSMQYMREKGIQTSIHYPPIHLLSYYKKLLGLNDSLPLTENVGRREITLPLFPKMDEEDVDYVVESIKEYLSQS